MMGADCSKIKIIPTGVDLSEFSHHSTKGKFKNKYAINSEKIVLYVGRLHKSKGIDLLIDSFSGLLECDNDSKLVLLGPDDGFKSILERQIQRLGIDDKVIFTGHVSEREKAAAFTDSDVFVKPKFYGLLVTFADLAMVCRLSYKRRR